MLAMPWSSKRTTHSPKKKNLASQVSQTIDVKEKDHPPSKEKSEVFHFQPSTSQKQKEWKAKGT